MDEPGIGQKTTETRTLTLEKVEEGVIAAFKAKRLWLDWAEIFDSWRFVPRTILYGYAAWTIHTCDRILTWYFKLPAEQQSSQNALLIGTVFTAVTSLFTLAVNFYQRSGRQWAGQPPP